MSVRSRLYRVYWRMQGVIAPRLRHSQELYEETLDTAVSPDARWLDLGCGHQLLPPWRFEQERRLAARCRQLVGLDYELGALQAHPTLALRVRGDITALPFAPETFDLVSANMVVEHLARPDLQFREVHRILTPGGLFLFHTPSIYGYPTALARLAPGPLRRKLVYLLDGRRDEDVFPTYYRANSPGTVAHVAAAAGFESIATRLIVSTALTAMIPPLAPLELLGLRLLMTKPLRRFRTNMIVTLRKPPGSA